MRAVFYSLIFFLVCVVEGKKKWRYYRDSNGAKTACDLKVHCKRKNGIDHEIPVSLPIRGPRGLQGESGKKGEPGDPGLPGLPGTPGLSAPLPKKVAFFAGLIPNMGPVERNTDIKFDNVVTNVGDAYDKTTGHFRAPFAGVYKFDAVISPIGGNKAAAHITKNGTSILTVWAESLPFWSTASNSVILQLKQSEEVWLALIPRASKLHGYMYSTFSGHLLFEMD